MHGTWNSPFKSHRNQNSVDLNQSEPLKGLELLWICQSLCISAFSERFTATETATLSDNSFVKSHERKIFLFFPLCVLETSEAIFNTTKISY